MKELQGFEIILISGNITNLVGHVKMTLDGGTRPRATTPTPTFSLQWEMGKQTHLDGGTLHPGQPCQLC